MTNKHSKALSIKELAKMPDSDIDYGDIPELDSQFWETAKVTLPVKKQRISIRFDSDLVEWFKRYGDGYQTRMNAVLRSYYEAQNKAGSNRQ